MRLTSVLVLVSIVAACTPAQSRLGSEITNPARYFNLTQLEFCVLGDRSPAPKYRVKSFRRTGKSSVELASRFHGLAIHDIEHGEYQYTLEPDDTSKYPEDFYKLSGRLGLYLADYWITLQLNEPVGGDYGQVDVTGKITNLRVGEAKEPVWIRLQGVVRNSEAGQARVNPDGSFRIPVGLITGDFVVTVYRGGDVLYVSVIRARQVFCVNGQVFSFRDVPDRQRFREASAARLPVQESWLKSDKSRGFGGRAPIPETLCSDSFIVVLSGQRVGWYAIAE